MLLVHVGLNRVMSDPKIEGRLVELSAGERAFCARHYPQRLLNQAFAKNLSNVAPHREFLNAMAEHDDADQYPKELVRSDTRTELDKFLWGREIIDFLLESPGVKFEPAEFVGLLKNLQPRLYSIASSIKAHPEQVHLTVDTVRYESHGRTRKGVCSNFLAERCAPETPVPVFVQTTKHFRLPEKGDVPIIMVGPGTGIAPFRAFLQERKVTGANGGNWLFFGAQKSECDFFYRGELEVMQREGGHSRAWILPFHVIRISKSTCSIG
jgi:sulfite reductase (NADPH) flavoprotein alpha-component